MRKLSTKTVQKPCSVLILQPVSSVQLLQACVLLPHNDSSQGILRSYSRHCVLVCINVFPHLPNVLPDLRESTEGNQRRAGRDFAGGHTACGAGAAAGAVWLRVQAFHRWPVLLLTNCVSSCVFMRTPFSLGKQQQQGF